MSPPPQQRLLESVLELCTRIGDAEPSIAVMTHDDDALLDTLGLISDALKALRVIEALATAEVARRSERALGYGGLAQRKGHRTGTDLIQSVTGQNRAEVRRATAAGNDLRAVLEEPADPDAGSDAAPLPHGRTSCASWFAPLTDALRSGSLSRDQSDAIRRGLGEPPADRYCDLDPEFLRGAWGTAASRLITEAADRGVEDLASAARLARDTLDPVGVQLRFDERFERRAFRTWIDQDGQHHARIDFDDEAAVWVHTILNAALRPRRGPRFVEAARPAESARVSDDARTNEQLQYDTMMAILRTGAAADPAQAFGDRQPGVRIIVPQQSLDRATDGTPAGTAFAEETQQALPASIAEQYLCNSGSTAIIVARDGNPLDVGRELRLFTKRQREALALRDGGCRWCGAEPSRCEAHHTSHWQEHGGRTDLADGVLLCRNCHMRLHNQGWRIHREATAYWLHPPGGGEPRELAPRSLLRFRHTGPT